MSENIETSQTEETTQENDGNWFKNFFNAKKKLLVAICGVAVCLLCFGAGGLASLGYSDYRSEQPRLMTNSEIAAVKKDAAKEAMQSFYKKGWFTRVWEAMTGGD